VVSPRIPQLQPWGVNLDNRTFRRLRSGAQREDRGSHLVILVCVVFGVLLGTVAAYAVPAATITAGGAFAYWLGIVLILAGVALRVYAVNTFGAYFTTSVSIATQQHIITAGPYRLVRHPSYTGILLALLGLALCYTNWLSLLSIVGFSLIGIGYRIRVEESVLQAQLGQPYQEYMRHTKRLIPYVMYSDVRRR